MLEIVPITLRKAKEFVATNHRHHPAPQGWKFGAGLQLDGKLVGVVIVGRPVSRMLAVDIRIAEVTRLCTTGEKNACTMLYGAARRAAKALGYKTLITYTLAEEPGTSLKASGFKEVARTKGGSWSRPSRPRDDKSPTVEKIRWEIKL